MLGQVIDSTYTDFLDLVAGSRGLDVRAVHNIAQGRVWTGADAKDIGLVDTLGGMDVAIGIAARKAGLSEDGYGILRVPRPKSLLEELEETLIARVSHALGWPAEAGLQKVRQYADLVEDAVRMQGIPQARMPLDVTIQ